MAGIRDSYGVGCTLPHREKGLYTYACARMLGAGLSNSEQVGAWLN